MPQGLLPFSSEHPHERYFRQSKVNGRRWNLRRIRNISIALILLCFFIYIAIFYVLDNNVEIDSQFETVVPEALLEKRVDFHTTVIDKMCSKETKTCYVVMDRLNQETKDVERHLAIDTFDLLDMAESDTVMQLIAPAGQTFESSDTRIWGVDRTKVLSQYVASVVVSPFIVSSLSIDENNVNKSVLEIGLGGGSVDAVLAEKYSGTNVTVVELDPVVVTIAEKWFGFQSSDRHKAIVADGVEYIKQMNEKGRRFDALIIDACDTSASSPCPAAPFRDPDVIDGMRSILTNQGCLIVNFLIREPRRKFDNVLRQVSRPFLDAFPACIQIKMTTETNVILICLPYTIGDPKEQMKFYSARLKVAAEKLGLKKLLHGIDVINIRKQ